MENTQGEVSEVVKEALSLEKRLHLIEQSLHDVRFILVGLHDKNGLRGEVQRLKFEVEEHEILKIRVMTVFLLVQMLVVPVLIAFILKYIS